MVSNEGFFLNFSPGGGGLTSRKTVVYGCTTLTNANQMLQQLAKLGHEM